MAARREGTILSFAARHPAKAKLANRMRGRLTRFFGRNNSSFLRVAKRDVLGVLREEQGCIFCRQGQKILDQFFFWYLHEGYGQLENLKRTSRSRGFCPAHTRRLISEGLPQTISSIYLPLISDAMEDLRRIEADTRSSNPPDRPGKHLIPKASCPACAARDRNRDHLLHSLQNTLEEPEIREKLRQRSFICLPHLLEISPHLGWEELRFLTEAMIRTLANAETIEVSEEINLLRSTLWGFEPGKGKTATGKIKPRSGPFETESSWSPIVEGLRRTLSEPGCPVCNEQRRALDIYFGWLSEEMLEQPTHRWKQAFRLCPEHGREFAFREEGAVVSKLARAIRGYWNGELEKLSSSLSRKPPEWLVLRLAKVPHHAYNSYRAETERGAGALLGELLEAFGKALRSPAKILPELRASVQRPYPCPACRYLETIANKRSDLISRAVIDPGMLQVYQNSSGLCFYHLPQALNFCTDPMAKEGLLRAQRVRLEILQWELREYQRKQSWDVRYEPKGPEKDSWRRAVKQYSGI